MLPCSGRAARTITVARPVVRIDQRALYPGFQRSFGYARCGLSELPRSPKGCEDVVAEHPENASAGPMTNNATRMAIFQFIYHVPSATAGELQGISHISYEFQRLLPAQRFNAGLTCDDSTAAFPLVRIAIFMPKFEPEDLFTTFPKQFA